MNDPLTADEAEELILELSDFIAVLMAELPAQRVRALLDYRGIDLVVEYSTNTNGRIFDEI